MYDVTPVTTGHSTACGPACLKMLLAYYGTDVPLDTLIDECGVRINGASVSDLLRVGRAHGMEELAAYSETPDDVIRQDRPAIIWWRYSHFVVFCGADGDDVWICNPSQGRYRIDAGTFRTLCSGIDAGTCVALCNGRPEDLPEPVPDDMLAKEDLTKGAHFIWRDAVWVALEAIPNGALIRPMRNCAQVALDTIINA